MFHADGADFRRQGLFINVITRLVLQDRGSVFLCNLLTKISKFAELILRSLREVFMCALKFPRPLRSLRDTNYQSIEFTPLKQAFVI